MEGCEGRKSKIVEHEAGWEQVTVLSIKGVGGQCMIKIEKTLNKNHYNETTHSVVLTSPYA